MCLGIKGVVTAADPDLQITWGGGGGGGGGGHPDPEKKGERYQ